MTSSIPATSTLRTRGYEGRKEGSVLEVCDCGFIYSIATGCNTRDYGNRKEGRKCFRSL